MISLLISFLVCLGFVAYFAGAEMAFVSSNKLKLRELKDSGSVEAASLLKFHQNPEHLLIAILVGTNVAYVAATSILTYLLAVQFHLGQEWIVLAIELPLMIVFAEMVPKDYCRMRAIPFLLSHTFSLKILNQVFYYPSSLFLKVMNYLLPTQGKEKQSIFVNEEEFRSLIEESARYGVVEPHEEKLIKTILDFERIQVHSVMLPVKDVLMVDIRSKVQDAKKLIRKDSGKIILVYEEIPSIIVGMVHVFDILLKGKDEQGLTPFLRSPVFIPETTSIEQTFLVLQERRQSYAVVVDSKGEVVGLVPIENLLMIEKRFGGR